MFIKSLIRNVCEVKNMTSKNINRNNKVLVMKFGGTSVGSPDALAHVISIVSKAQNLWGCVIVVVSAIAGITDKLLEAVKLAKKGAMIFVDNLAADVRLSHLELIKKCVANPDRQQAVSQKIEGIIEELIDLYQAVSVLREDSPRTLDNIVSLGERMSIQLVSVALSENGVDATPVEATQLIVTSCLWFSI